MIAIDTSYWWSTSTLADPNLVAEPYLFRSLFFVVFFSIFPDLSVKQHKDHKSYGPAANPKPSPNANPNPNANHKKWVRSHW